MPDAHLEDLIAPYLAGELSPEKAAEVRGYLEATPGRRGVMAGIVAAARGEDVALPPSVDAMHAQLMARLDASEHLLRKVDASVQSRGRGTWSFGSQILRRSLQSVGLAAAGLIVLAVWNAPRRIETTTTYTTQTGQLAMVTLPDSTRVRLAPRTTLRLERFGVRSRAVVLDGAAYFEVTRAGGAPFIVHTGTVSTRVLGTAFLVQHYRDEPAVRVAVKSGKVMTYTDRRTAMTVSAGEIGDLRDSLTSVRKVDNLDGETGWLKDELVFTHAPLPDVLASLGRWYGYEFRCADSTLSRERVTMWLSTRSRVKALATLERVLNVSLTISGDTVTLIPQRTPAGSKKPREKSYDVFAPSREVGR